MAKRQPYHKQIDRDEVYALFVAGKTKGNKTAIARKLKVDESTIRYHLSMKLAELEAQNATS